MKVFSSSTASVCWAASTAHLVEMQWPFRVSSGLNGLVDGHVYTVSARDITEPTTFDGFVVNGESQLNGNGNAYGIYVYDSTSALTITNNRIAAGNGGRGEDGGSGASGTPGTAGASGLQAYNRRTPGGCQAISYTTAARWSTSLQWCRRQRW